MNDLFRSTSCNGFGHNSSTLVLEKHCSIRGASSSVSSLKISLSVLIKETYFRSFSHENRMYLLLYNLI